MSKEKRRVPKLRFPGFTEDWEQRKLSDITYLSGIKNKENKPYESYSISNEFGFIPQAEQFENGGTMQTADKSMYYIVSQNSFAYNPARINVGSIGYYDKPDNVIVSSLYEVFKTTDIVNDKFLWHWFKSNQFNRLIGKYQEGGVRLYFYYDKLCKGTMGLPAINEQNKISNLLDDLDMYITLHQRKLDNLKLKKKALLQKLFPKNGDRYPELRFPGFTDAWEQRKLSDITYLSGIKNKENKPYESYSISNEFGFIPQAEQFENGGTMQTADKSMYYIVSQNSFAYNPARINVGSIGYYDKPDNVIVSSLYEVFKTTDIVNDKFLWHWFKSNQFNRLIGKYQEGGVRLYFYYDKLCKGTMGLPAINEQNKISNLLDDLDMYITLHQRKLDHLQLQKKALLQQMFV